MSDQTQTTANNPAEPVLCKAGCGFFGNAATGGCCSKCWRDQHNKKGADNVHPEKRQETTSIVKLSEEEVPPLVVSRPKAPCDSGAGKPVATAPKKGNKKKKASYKSMMSGVMSSSPTRDVEKEQREKIAKGVGGGAFSKIDKI